MSDHSNADYRRPVNAYFTSVLGTPVEPSTHGLFTVETARRLGPEEGYGGAWPVYLLKVEDGWWLSVAPDLLACVRDPIAAAHAAGRFDDALAAELRSAASDCCPAGGPIRYAGRSLLFVPAGALLSPTPPEGYVIRPLSRADNTTSAGGAFVPTESIDAGTAFGAFTGDMLASWAEATPLPTVTPRFGVTLVGIETVAAHRRRGLARSVLSTLTCRVLDLGHVPLYSCAASNVASQRTALSCGYVLYGETIRLQV